MFESQTSRSISIRIIMAAVLVFTFSWTILAQTEVKVERGEVVYVSGQTLVVRADTGEVRTFTVKPEATFDIDGRTLALGDLKPGMKLQRTITTSTQPQTVQSVRTIQGKVWFVSPPTTVILTNPNGENKQYKVPPGTVFEIDGQKKTVFDLRKGMRVSATIVSTSESIMTSVARSGVSGTAAGVAAAAPAPTRVETPQFVGVLLIEEPVKDTPASAASSQSASSSASADAEPAPNRLPKTASELPLIGMMGLAFIGAGLIARARRS